MFAACFLLPLPFNHEDVDDISSEVSGFLRMKRPFIPENLTLQYMCIANATLYTREREETIFEEPDFLLNCESYSSRELYT